VHSFGTFGLGFLILIIASKELALVWTVGKIFYLCLALICSITLIASINFTTNCISFWEPQPTSTVPFMIANTTELAKFPIEVYSPLFQFIFIWILPYAFVSYYPGVFLLDRPETSWVSYIIFVPALMTSFIAALTWRNGLTRYQSAGH
jgi:ABC-2 type transport system permease protein